VPQAGLPQILIEVFISRGVPGNERFLFQCLFRIGNNLLPINSNDPAKPLASRAGTEGAIKGEEKGLWLRKISSTTVAGKATVESYFLTLLCHHLNFTIPQLKPSLNGLG
jgi:hypothetical protein